MSIKELAAIAAAIIVIACAPPNGSAQPEPRPRVDHSLTTAEYLQLGMPAPDRVWSTLDYQTAQGVITALSADQLPRWRDSASSEVYTRIADPSGLESCSNRIHQLSLRMQSCMTLISATSGIYGKYAAALQNDPGYIEEMAPLMSLALRLQAAASRTGDEFMASLNRNDPTFHTRQQGLAQFDLGTMQMVQGAIHSLSTGRSLFSDAAALNLAQAMTDTFPILSVRMPPMTRAEFEGNLRRIATVDPSADVRLALANLVESAATQ